ncbi:DNA-directed RNA polymerase I subunit RPA12 [Conglomerata obtusa]
MFCNCGTILQRGNSSIVTCARCFEEHPITIFKPIISIKHYKPTIDIRFKKTQSAKIRFKCNRCGNEEMNYNTIQTRSADEGQTVFYECECGYKEKVHS